jgi:hypothetical protein
MDALQWMDTAFRALLAGFFALMPGMTVWTVMLALFLLIRRIGFERRQKSR